MPFRSRSLILLALKLLVALLAAAFLLRARVAEGRGAEAVTCRRNPGPASTISTVDSPRASSPLSLLLPPVDHETEVAANGKR